jgi:hypothetical protein
MTLESVARISAKLARNQECLPCAARAILSGKRPRSFGHQANRRPKLAASLLDKAAELNDKVADVSMQNIDSICKRPTWSGKRDLRRLLRG